MKRNHTHKEMGEWRDCVHPRKDEKMLDEAGLEIDRPGEVRQSRGRIIIEPIGEMHFELKALLDGIRDDNLHATIDTSPPLGREVW